LPKRLRTLFKNIAIRLFFFGLFVLYAGSFGLLGLFALYYTDAGGLLVWHEGIPINNCHIATLL